MLRGLLATLVALAVAACGEDGPTGPTTPNIAGTWALISSTQGESPYTVSDLFTGQTLVAEVADVDCSFSGDGTITQSGQQFSATANLSGTCTFTMGPSFQFVSFALDASGPQTYSGGTITGSQVTLRDSDACTYTGTISGSPPNRVAGTYTCPTQDFDTLDEPLDTDGDGINDAFLDFLSLTESGTWTLTR